ncbi:MAG TPA: Holliday junction resolvase RuvX [Anaerolineae bacterium]|nr:Holliday junction resolvase RuvX [Anaerolineae bacterium]HQH39069.1 Holliday junction resolvase RuvX [Anaerolineae bacterium]
MRYLALDLGERRIGVAVSDALGILARPLEIFRRTSRAADFAHIGALVTANQVDAVVVGLPLNMDGSVGRQAAWVSDYSTALAAAIAVPVYLWDERLTSEEAADVMRAQGKSPLKGTLDAVAAAVILQSYLDAHRQQ